MRLDRRQFCAGTGALLGSGLLGLSGSGCQKVPQPGATDLPDAEPPAQMQLQVFGSGAAQVVEVRWSAAVDLRGKVDPSKVKVMLDAAMEKLTGTDKPWSEWAGGSRRISVKVNSITSQSFAHPELAAAMAGNLVSAGSDPSRVTVWDRDTDGLRNRGYTIDESGKQLGFRCLGTDASGASASGSAESAVVAGSKVYFSRLLSESDVLFNVAALKDHSMAAVTLSLKNNLGMIWGAERLHGNIHEGSGCEPGISELAARPEIKGRLQLAMIDALVGVCEGGPGPAKPEHAFRYAGILVSRDPVALDRRGLAIIEARRRRLGLVPLSQRTDPNPSPSAHIDNAAALGVSPG